MRIELPWPPKELSPNYSGTLRSKMRAQKYYRNLCHALTLEQVGRWRPAAEVILPISLSFYQPDRRNYDDDNLESRFKRGRDGVALALKVDDHRFRVTRIIHDEIIKGGKIVLEFK
jgi:crossover junction endodeoxyribonuclease RusA